MLFIKLCTLRFLSTQIKLSQHAVDYDFYDGRDTGLKAGYKCSNREGTQRKEGMELFCSQVGNLMRMRKMSIAVVFLYRLGHRVGTFIGAWTWYWLKVSSENDAVRGQAWAMFPC